MDLLKGTNIYLVGMMGTGKTTVGREIANDIGYRFVDTDATIAAVTKQSINQLFARQGETGFRQIETQVLSQVCAYTRLAIATGGGIVLSRKNWSYLHHGLVIWLDAPIEILHARLVADTTRPLLQDTDLFTQLETLMQQRRSLYAQADLHITITNEETPKQLATRVLTEIPHVLKQERDN